MHFHAITFWTAKSNKWKFWKLSWRVLLHFGMWFLNEWQPFYCVLPFFGRKDARCRLEPFRDNVRFRCCDCFLFWEFWLSWIAWDSLLVIQSVTYCDVLFHQPQFVEVGLITSVFCDSSKLLFVSLPGDTDIFLNESIDPIVNPLLIT